MVPRNQDSELMTRDGVKNMIFTYDQEVIVPRQSKQHEDNLKVQKEHSEILNKWVGAIEAWTSAIRAVGWFILALVALMMLIIAILGYEHESHKAILQSDAPSSVVAETAPWR